jgi:very-short-patch-repair endonuclease
MVGSGIMDTRADPFSLGDGGDQGPTEIGSTAALFSGGRGSRRNSRGKRDDSGERGFGFWARALRLPTFVPKFKLAKSVQEPRKDGRDIPRQWEFDWCCLAHKLIVEIDGGVWIGGAHAHPVDITRNMAKRNDAVLAGFYVLAFTPAQAKKADAAVFTQSVLVARGWVR